MVRIGLFSFLFCFLLASCTKEKVEPVVYMNALYKNQSWTASTVSASFINPNRLDIIGSGANTTIKFQLHYTGLGDYPINIEVRNFNPWYVDSHNVAGIAESGYYTIINPVRIKGLVTIQSITSKKVKGTFTFAYIYDDSRFNFAVTGGQFLAPVN